MLAKHIACGAGLGLIKPAPGTWGSLGAVLLALAIWYGGTSGSGPMDLCRLSLSELCCWPLSDPKGTAAL